MTMSSNLKSLKSHRRKATSNLRRHFPLKSTTRDSENIERKVTRIPTMTIQIRDIRTIHHRATMKRRKIRHRIIALGTLNFQKSCATRTKKKTKRRAASTKKDAKKPKRILTKLNQNVPNITGKTSSRNLKNLTRKSYQNRVSIENSMIRQITGLSDVHVFLLTEYVHVKEVPEIDSHNNPVVRKRQQKNKNRSRGNDEQREESRSQESRTYRKNRKVPRTGYRDVAAYASDISVQTAPKVIYEEAFEYKNPETGKPYLKHAKTEKYVSPKKSPKEDSYFHAAKYYKHMSENKDPYLSSSNWKASKTLAEETVLRSNVRQLSDPRGGTSFYGPSAVSGHARSLTNAEILRDLTGI